MATSNSKMPGGSPEEQRWLMERFQEYLDIKDECTRTGDWTGYARMFEPNAGLVDHHGFGKFRGRQEIEEYITKSIGPFGNMSFTIDWVAVDVNTRAVVFQVENVFPAPPLDPKTGQAFQFPNWTRLVFRQGDSLLIESEETVYNPLRDAGRTFKSWREAGGEPVTKEQLKYKFSNYKTAGKL